MKKLWGKKEYLIIGIVIVILFTSFGFLSFFSISRQRGNARVINYAGIVRGATQKLVKKELMGHPDDALITRLDTIVDELISGEGPNDLVALDDPAFQKQMSDVKSLWEKMKGEIQKERREEANALYEQSEEYFTLVDEAVSFAEVYSEQQVVRLTRVLAVIVILFLLFIATLLALIFRTASLQKRADALDKIAYIDPLTQMYSRASCEKEIYFLNGDPPENDLLVFMIDMNSLKLVNERLGHQGGDRIIADFARIIRNEAIDFGFAGRYGGDEFITIFQNGSEQMAIDFLSKVNEKVVAYNLLHINDIEKISFAAGYYIGNRNDMSVEGMIDMADKQMYKRKKEMKEESGMQY